MLIQLIEGVYRLLWGDLLTLHLGNVTLSLSFMVILLLTAGVFFTLRTRLLPVRLFRDMLAAVCEKNDKGSGLSSFQTLMVSTATRVAVDTISVWKDERPLPLSFFSQTAASISRNSRTGRSLVRRVKNTPAVSSRMTINERLRVTFPRCRVSRSPHNRR